MAYTLGWVLEGYTPDDHPKTLQDSHRIVAVGDLACPPGLLTLPGQCQQAQTAQIAKSFDPEDVLLLGDTQYPDGKLSDYNNSFDKSWGVFGHKLKPAPGNHEWRTPNAAGYFEYFGSKAGVGTQGYYSYDLGDWHLISLDSDCYWTTGCGPKTTQYQWLENDLKAHPAQCTLAYWHHPLFTSGEYRYAAAQRAAGQSFFELLYRFHADLVLNGHDHIYERFAHLNPQGKPDPAGIRQITVGTGGRSHSVILDRLPGSQFIDGDHFGVLEMYLGQGAYTWNFVDTQGDVLDKGSDKCHSALL